MTLQEFRDRLRALIVEAINAGIGARQIMEELITCPIPHQRSDDNEP